jgi:hypothetical protein
MEKLVDDCAKVVEDARLLVRIYPDAEVGRWHDLVPEIMALLGRHVLVGEMDFRVPE